MCRNSNSDEYLCFAMLGISCVHTVLPHGQFSIVYLLKGQLQQVCVSLSFTVGQEHVYGQMPLKNSHAPLYLWWLVWPYLNQPVKLKCFIGSFSR